MYSDEGLPDKIPTEVSKQLWSYKNPVLDTSADVPVQTQRTIDLYHMRFIGSSQSLGFSYDEDANRFQIDYSHSPYYLTGGLDEGKVGYANVATTIADPLYVTGGGWTEPEPDYQSEFIGSLGGVMITCLSSAPTTDITKKDLNFYKGSIFSQKEIENSIKDSRLKYIKPDNIYETVSNFLKEGKIIAWFQEGAEFGPRALGNRSILCKPYPVSMRDYLNKKVKFREEFRPFAPAVLDKYQKEFFELDQESPHMLIATKVMKNKKNSIPAVVHIDDTCRVQTVKESVNKKFYKLIESFHKATGIPVLLNTSFNVKGQPIVNTPLEALETFKNTNIDVLAIGDFVLVK